MLYQFIVYSHEDDLMLFNNSEGEISIPSFQAAPFHIADVKIINDYFYKNYNLVTNILRCMHKEESKCTYEVEVLNTEALINSKSIEWVWVNPSSREIMIRLDYQEQRLLYKWKNIKKSHLPWELHGFRNKIEEWAKGILSDEYCSSEQVRTWEKGMLLKVYGRSYNYYVKSVPEIFAHEPHIHNSLPEFVPEILAIYEDNTYMMREIKGDLLGYNGDIDNWKETANRIAKLQKWFLNNKSQFKPTIPERSIQSVLSERNLKETINALHSYISYEKIQKLLSNVPVILDRLESLNFNSIFTIDHGDLFGGNVIVEGEDPLIYDWSNSALSHPFLSIIRLIEEVTEFFSEEHSKIVQEFYLVEWSDHGHLKDLSREISIIQLLEPVYYLTVHMLIIFPEFHYNSDKKEIIDGYVTKWLGNMNN